MARKGKRNPSSPNEIVQSSNRFFGWMQEFSKKIIFYTFILYIGINVFIIIMTAIMYFQTQSLQCLDTMIAEINTTFRDIIGGYIVKAAVENVSKNSGSIIERWIDTRALKILDENTDKGDEEVVEKASNIIERNGLTWRRKE